MELELGRINLFDTFDGCRRTSVKVFGFGLALIVIGISSGVVNRRMYWLGGLGNCTAISLGSLCD